MIRKFKDNDLDIVMQIWLDTNIRTHDFTIKDYWTGNYEAVKKMLPQAELYVYEAEDTGRIEGFIGLTGNYIAGIFVKDKAQSKGVGKRLLDYVKDIKPCLTLNVFAKNVRAMHFYQREHFAIQSKSIDDNTSENEFVMVWERTDKS